MQEGKIVMKAIPDEIWEQMQSDITEIKVALLGNEYNPYGALRQIKEHEKIIAELNNKVNKMLWTAGGVGAAAGTIISLLLRIFPNIQL